MRQTYHLQKRTDDDDEITLDLVRLARALLRNWWVLLLAAVLVAVCAYIGSRILITPTYRASFSAYVNNRTSSTSTETVSSSDITASENLTSTYAVIISSQPNVESALDESGLNYTYDQVEDWISISTVDDTQVIQVNVTSPDPETSYQLAAALQSVSPDFVSEIVEGSSMKIVATAIYPTNRYSPSYSRNAVIGAVFGFILAAAILILKDLMDRRIKNASELQERFGIPVVGVIHDLNKTESGGYYGYGKTTKKPESRRKSSNSKGGKEK